MSDSFCLVYDGYPVQFHLTNLPISCHFVDRDREMGEIEHNTRQIRYGTEANYILNGLSGSGKSQLVTTYVWKYSEIYSAILAPTLIIRSFPASHYPAICGGDRGAVAIVHSPYAITVTLPSPQQRQDQGGSASDGVE